MPVCQRAVGQRVGELMVCYMQAGKLGRNPVQHGRIRAPLIEVIKPIDDSLGGTALVPRKTVTSLHTNNQVTPYVCLNRN